MNRYTNISSAILTCVFCLLYNFKMSGTQLLSDQGLRIDGRKPNELRRIKCSLGVFAQADGSAYLEQGNTKVLAAVYGPHEVTTVSYNFKSNLHI